LPGGVEQHFSELPMRPEDKGESVEEHAERALVTYPFPQQVSTQNGRRLVASGSKVVRERLNGEYGLSQIWTIKINKSFLEDFTVTTTNPNIDTFHPQAVFEFECAINKIFGNGATSKHPILYAAHTKLSDEKIYKGTAKALERFLRAQPRVCDQLNITKLYPGGFVALKHYPSKADSCVFFDFPLGNRVCVLYLKRDRIGVGGVPVIKNYEQFVAEKSELGPRRRDLEMPREADAGRSLSHPYAA